MKPLFIPLKTQFFEAFKDGSKTTEYRKFGPRWNLDTCTPGRAVTLSKGYGKHERLSGTIVSFKMSTDICQTSSWIACYGTERATAACIEIKLTP